MLRSYLLLSYSRNFMHFMKPKSSLEHSQQPASDHYPEPDGSSPDPPILLLQDPFEYYPTFT